MSCVLCQNKHLISYLSKQPTMWDKVHRKKENKKNRKIQRKKTKNQLCYPAPRESPLSIKYCIACRY